jgi:ElaB/YqjD/DUF883 family membrane-anchored ribosome-binding protein
VSERDIGRQQQDETVREHTNPLQEGTEGQGERARERASEMGREARERMSEYGQEAQHRAEEGRERTAESLGRAATEVRGRAGNMPGGQQVAEGMERTAEYLREHDTTEIMNDVERYVRQHPMQAIAGAVVAGFVIARILR